MTEPVDERVSPDIPALLRVLKEYSVVYVLVGSVAVEAWGADVGMPGDLDIVPSLDRDNLEQLARAMQVADARSWPVTGHWETDSAGEVRWIEYEADDPRRGSTRLFLIPRTSRRSTRCSPQRMVSSISFPASAARTMTSTAERHR